MLNVNDFYKKLDALYGERDYKKALEYMLESESEAQKRDDPGLMLAVANEIGAMYRIQGNTDRALKEYNKVMQLLERLGMYGSKNHATALINLANVYTAMRDFESSYRCGSEAVVILQRLGENDYEIASLNNNMSIALRELGRLEEARGLAKRSIDIILNLPGKEIEKATSYLNLGQIEAKAGELAGARKTLSYAISLFERVGALQDFHYIVAVHALAEVDELENHLHPALDGYKKARYLYETSFGRNRYYEYINKCIERVEIKLDEF